VTTWLECDDGSLANLDHFCGFLVQPLGTPLLFGGVALTHELRLKGAPGAFDWGVARTTEDRRPGASGVDP
jgi:hypothetical protein